VNGQSCDIYVTQYQPYVRVASSFFSRLLLSSYIHKNTLNSRASRSRGWTHQNQ